LTGSLFREFPSRWQLGDRVCVLALTLSPCIARILKIAEEAFRQIE